MRYLGNGIGHRATNHIHFDDINTGHSISNSSAELGEVDENSDVDHVGELNEISDSDGNDGDLEETISNEDDDYGYNHNRLIHEDEEWDTDGPGMGENFELNDDDEDDWESMYMD